jgi:hypothetical protein
VHGKTPLFHAFGYMCTRSDNPTECDKIIGTLRNLLESPDNIDDFEDNEWDGIALLVAGSYQITSWLWDHATNTYSGPELLAFQTILYRDILNGLCRSNHKEEVDTTLQLMTPKFLLPSCLLSWEIWSGNIGALNQVYRFSRDEHSSQEEGSRYIAFLTSLGTDAESSIRAELEQLPGQILVNPISSRLDRRVIFYQDDEQNWVLRWEWVLDQEATAYDLLSEFCYITFSGKDTWNWPFHEYDWGLSPGDRYRVGRKWDERYARRLANTIRKELARTGQKRPRCRMPGAWI